MNVWLGDSHHRGCWYSGGNLIEWPFRKRNSWRCNSPPGCQISGRSESVHPIFSNGTPCSSKMGIRISPIKIKIMESVQKTNSHIMLMDSHSLMWRESVGLPWKISYLTTCAHWSAFSAVDAKVPDHQYSWWWLNIYCTKVVSWTFLFWI